VSVSMPCNILSRASTENFTSLADISIFLFVRLHLEERLLGEPNDEDDRSNVFSAFEGLASRSPPAREFGERN
jgi:hypothetical protein